MNGTYDLLLRNGAIVRPDGVIHGDVAVSDGQTCAIGPELTDRAKVEVDLTGCHLLPGLIDSHVHFNEPGRAEWEGIATGSRALAAGGGTLFADMPLNSTPPVVDAASLRAKRKAAEAVAVTDFALWGGLVPGNRDCLAEMAAAGAIGFKAFLCDSGLPEFPAADDLTLYEGMVEARRLGLPVAVHAENGTLVAGLQQRLEAVGRSGVQDYLASRPVLAEVEAVQRALLLARETGVKLHVVHVSSGRSVASIAEAKVQGVDVTCETCPHYLLFTDEDLERIGAALKCAPPVRSRAERDRLTDALHRGMIDLIASDHSPTLPILKEGEDYFAMWGGVAGVQSTLPALLSLTPALPLGKIALLTSEVPASRFGLTGKGHIAVGYDADFTVVDLGQPAVLTPDTLLQRHALSPYLGRSFPATIRRTIVRGRTIFCDGMAETAPWGRLIDPTEGA